MARKQSSSDHDSGPTSSSQSSNPPGVVPPDVGRPRGAAWRSLQSEGIETESQVQIVGGESDLAARLIVTPQRLVLAAGGEIIIDLARTWLRPNPRLVAENGIRLFVTPEGETPGDTTTERITLRARDGRGAAMQLISDIAGHRVPGTRAETAPVAVAQNPEAPDVPAAIPAEFPSWKSSVGAARPIALQPLPDTPTYATTPAPARTQAQHWPPVEMNGISTPVRRPITTRTQFPDGTTPRSGSEMTFRGRTPDSISSWTQRHLDGQGATTQAPTPVPASVSRSARQQGTLGDGRAISEYSISSVPKADSHHSFGRSALVWGLRAAILLVLVGTGAYLGRDYLREQARDLDMPIPAQIESQLGISPNDGDTDPTQIAEISQIEATQPTEVATLPPALGDNVKDDLGGTNGPITTVTVEPTEDPSGGQIAAPVPTDEPVIVEPTDEFVPTDEPIIEEPTVEIVPTDEPVTVPTAEILPTDEPVVMEPTVGVRPTEEPVVEPTDEPVTLPTLEPTIASTLEPIPTDAPVIEPTLEPTVPATAQPTASPAAEGTTEPTIVATTAPVETTSPTKVVEVTPTLEPQAPSVDPSATPVQQIAAGGLRYSVDGASLGETVPQLPEINAVGYGEWLILTVTGENTTDAAQVFDMSAFKLYADGQEVLVDVGNSWVGGLLGFTPAYGNTDAIQWAPGESHQFALTFLAPLDAQSLVLQVGGQSLDLSKTLQNNTTLVSAQDPSAQPEFIEGTVVDVIDAETIVVEIDGIRQTVRYLGLDVPAADECYGSEADAANAALVNGKTVRIERQATNADARGNWVRDVWAPTEDGRYELVSTTLVAEGAARAGVTEPNTRFSGWLMGSEAAAKAQGLGLWSRCGDGSDASSNESADAADASGPIDAQPTIEPVGAIVPTSSRGFLLLNR